MTPVEEVRKLLDKHGIKYTIDDSEYYEIIEWQGPYNLWWQFLYDPYDEAPYGELRLLDTGGSTTITPAQAVAATVGAGTCHITVEDNLDETEGIGDVWLECDECHWQMMLEPSTPRFKFCPNCGRRIEVDE